MGEHGTWFDYLNRFEWWQHFNAWADGKLGRTHPMLLLFQQSGWSLTHVLIELVVLAFSVWGAIAFYRGLKTPDHGVVPPRKMNLRAFFEYTAESVYGMVEGEMGKDNAAKFFPLIGALWIYIFFGNLVGLIPGFVSPNDTLKTNVGIALLVFLLTHYYGVRKHGLAYFKHFLGPSLVLAPLMLPIEIISHLARPVSLSIRLMGNMMADHKVVMSFFALVPIIVPIPFLLLGLLICWIQALVFTSLAMVYISMAIEDHEDHDHDHAHDHAHAH
ncbi:MAG TPA: F0F1 ATP synthase subunit A [Kofleriaceae bacterium]|nr:F0F1 ATP synthase subunit A [Kofleriaceae bacterium]